MIRHFTICAKGTFISSRAAEKIVAIALREEEHTLTDKTLLIVCALGNL